MKNTMLAQLGNLLTCKHSGSFSQHQHIFMAMYKLSVHYSRETCMFSLDNTLMKEHDKVINQKSITVSYKQLAIGKETCK